MYLWETVRGQRLFDRIPWVPYVYEKTDDGQVTTIDGEPVRRHDFANYQEYYNYQKEVHTAYENGCPTTTQFLAERYHGISDDELEVPELLIASIDCEVHTEPGSGFPHPQDAKHPIVLINVRTFGNPVSRSFGLKPYTGENKYNVNYTHCPNESELLRAFLTYFQGLAPDVLTGWNIMSDNKMNKMGGFDLPYIINRCKALFGEDTKEYHKLSPVNRVKVWTAKDTGAMVVEIAGVSIIDYLALYKWYTTKKLESYRLDVVSKFELEEGKLDYSEYNDLRTLFHENWNLYVDYNVVDNLRVEQLETKLGYIRIPQALALLCKCQMKSYKDATQLVEGVLLTYYRRNNMCAPKFAGGEQEWFPAAFVKDPIVHYEDWNCDLDIASSYPTAIITLNISNETYYGRIITPDKAKELNMDNGNCLSEPEIIESCRNREFTKPFKMMGDDGIVIINGKQLTTFNKALKKGLFAIAPCGSIFTTTKPGVLAVVEKGVFFKRKEVKKRMFAIEKKATDLPDGEEKNKLKNRSKELFAYQWALKILLNGMFGIMAVPFSRYFNPHMAEAITACGRITILQGEKYVNRVLGNPEIYPEFNDFMESIKKEINQ